MNTTLLTALAAVWRTDAERFRVLGQDAPSRMSDAHAAELEQRVSQWETEELSIAEAAEESGYSDYSLREMVRNGRLPDSRPAGSEGRISIRRCDLPRKPSSEPTATDGVVGEMLELIR